MKISRMYIFTIILILSGVGFIHGQKIESIKPMISTCEDVKKILGIETCRKSHEVYDLVNETVVIDYSTMICQTAYLKSWNIPIGTVLSVIVIPKKELSIKDFSVNLNKCEVGKFSTDIGNKTIYYCKEIGTSFSIMDDHITEITYTPTPKDSKFICKKPINKISPKKTTGKNK